MTVSRDTKRLVKRPQALLVAAWPYRRGRSQGLSGPYDLRGKQWLETGQNVVLSDHEASSHCCCPLPR